MFPLLWNHVKYLLNIEYQYIFDSSIWLDLLNVSEKLIYTDLIQIGKAMIFTVHLSTVVSMVPQNAVTIYLRWMKYDKSSVKKKK